MEKKWSSIFGIALVIPSLSIASIIDTPFTQRPIYFDVNAGIFQGNFDASYKDQTDVIPQPIAETVTQHGYTYGAGIGYRLVVKNDLLIGIELAGNIDTNKGRYDSGSSSTAFQDATQITHNIDILFTPGILITDTFSSYLKLGWSWAAVEDALTSPVGFAPAITGYNSNRNATGFAAGIGFKKYITPGFSVFTEYNYHDYGVVNFTNFTNFTADYTHSAHIYGQSVVLGGDWSFC